MLSVRQGSLRREKEISLYPERRTRLCQCRGARVMGRKEPCEQTVCSGWSSTHFEHRLGGSEDLCQGVMPQDSCEAFGTLLVGMGVPLCWERWDGIILKDPAFSRQNLGFVFYKWAMYIHRLLTLGHGWGADVNRVRKILWHSSHRLCREIDV